MARSAPKVALAVAGSCLALPALAVSLVLVWGAMRSGPMDRSLQPLFSSGVVPLAALMGAILCALSVRRGQDEASFQSRVLGWCGLVAAVPALAVAALYLGVVGAFAYGAFGFIVMGVMWLVGVVFLTVVALGGERPDRRRRQPNP